MDSVDKSSNHPPGILKNIPKSVNNRLSKISANQEVFIQACTPFQEALKKSGYDYKLNFNPPVPNQTNSSKRKRNILRFHPPYSQHVQTNIGQKFLRLIDQHFPKQHPLGKIINRNYIKYQPSGAGGTRSPPATPHRLQHLIACFIQNGRRLHRLHPRHISK